MNTSTIDRSADAGSLSPQEKLALLSDIGTLVISEPLHHVLDRIVNAARQLTSSDDCTVFLFDYQRDELVASRHRGSYEAETENETVRLRVGEDEEMDPVARAHRLGRPVHRRQGVRYARGWQAESLVSVPILASGKKLGVLCACRQTEGTRLTEQDEAFLRNLASYAAVAIEHDSQKEEAKRSAEALSELYSVTQSLHSDRDLQAVLKGCVSGALKVSKATAALLYLYDHETGDVEMPPIIEGELRQRDVVERRNVRTDHRRSVVFRILQRRRPFYAENAVEDWVRAGLQDSDPQDSFIGREGIASSAAIPLHGSRYPVGVLFINYRKPQTFTRATKERLELFAEQAARHIRFQQHAKRHLTSLQTLNEIGNVISAAPTPDVKRICELVHAQTERLMDVTNFFVCLYDEAERSYKFAHMEDEFDRPEQFTPHDLTRGLTARVQLTEQPLLVNDENRADVRRQVGAVVGREAACWLGVPMIARGKFRGVIAVQSYEDANAYTEEDRELLSTIALQTAVTIDNAQRLGAAEQRTTELRAMCEALERISDPYDQPENLLHDLVRRAAETCSAPSAALYGHRPKTKEHWLICAHPDGAEDARSRSDAGSLVDRVLRTPKTHFKAQALCAPLIVEGECIGAMLLRGRDFARSDRELLERFAELTAIVMHHVSKARFRSKVVQALPRPMIAVDTEGRVMEFNNYNREILGFSPERILGRDVVDLYWNGLEEARRIKKLLYERGRITFEPSALRNAKGERVEVLLSASMLRDDEGNEIGSVALIEPSNPEA